jgi:hypothetical protein
MFLFFVVFPFFQQKIETETRGPKMDFWKHWVGKSAATDDDGKSWPTGYWEQV